MNMFKTATRALCAAAMAVGCLAGAADAQVSPAEEQRLRAEQAALFEKMFEEPDNLDLMFEYALLSIRLLDYEAAISTLERILIFNPDLPRVRTELGAAYFRIGSYPVARHYFSEVLTDPTSTPDLRVRVNDFIAEIDRRTSKSTFSGSVGLNLLFSTNANNGPGDGDILLNGVLIADALGANVQEQDDFGASFSLQLSHKYDLGGPDGDFWRTDAAALSARYDETPDGAVDVLVLRSGPRLSLNDDRYGPKLRPYGEFSHARSSNAALQTIGLVGAEYTNTLSPTLSMFADTGVGWRDNHREGGDRDGITAKASIGLNYFQSEDVSMRGRGFFEYDGAQDKSDRSYQIGVDGSIGYLYTSGFEIASRKWRVGANARLSYRYFHDEADEVAGAFHRQDVDARVGMNHTAFLQDGMSMNAKAEFKVRESNILNFDLDALNLSVGLNYAF